MRTSKLILALILILIGSTLDAQYFGRNKPRYRSFDFKVKETPHFDIYNYLENEPLLDQLGYQTERWYKLHQAVLRDTFYQRNPLIFYNNHADFQQTNTISGVIGVGTGGVTEAFKNRVVMPLAMTKQQTHHVLGHELVHAFQYHMIINGDSTSLRSMANYPLWMIEGLAEYLSIGRFDPNTSMWMRDAVLNDDVPELKKMNNFKYFPYRYGQAFWAFISGAFGDQYIQPLFYETAKYGMPYATQSVLGLSLENLSDQWISALKTHYDPYLKDRKENTIGKKLLSNENAGNMNISPSLSPNGRYVVFMSEKDLFSTDLFLADARKGTIIRKIAQQRRGGHIEALNFLESTGTWSPNSRKFAFIAISKGKNILIIKDIESADTEEVVEMPDIPAISNPAWSPNGNEILFTGLKQGQTDLFSYNLKTKSIRQLTNDEYSEIQANFSADGQQVTYSTDKNAVNYGRENGRLTFDIAILDMSSLRTEILDIFPGADNLNPSYDHQGNILFVSDRDGYKNMYKYVTGTGEVLQMTDLITGISGITAYSPSIAVSRKRDRILYTHFSRNTYTIYEASSNEFLNKNVDPKQTNFEAALLPVVGLGKVDVVNKNLGNIENLQIAEGSTREASENNLISTFKDKKYKSKLSLDYVGGGAGVGVGNNTAFTNQAVLQGAVQLLFGDMLGNNQLFASLAMNGEIYDIGAGLSWINRKNKVAYGASISHTPQSFGSILGVTQEPLTLQNGQTILALKQSVQIARIFNQQVGTFFHFPLSSTFRFEGGVGLTRRAFRIEQRDQYYQEVGFNQFLFLGEEVEQLNTPDIINFGGNYLLQSGLSYGFNVGMVGDNSFFGITSPIKGQRYRLSFDKYLGVDDFMSITADYRKYIWLKPFSFAFRGMGIIRFEDTEDIARNPFYLGEMGLIHGFDPFFNFPFNAGIDGDVNPSDLLGNKLIVSNFEIRIPFTGPKQMSLIGTNGFFSDLNFFVDAGMAFDTFDQFNTTDSELFVRTGVGLRINMYGALILEPYYSWPVKGGGPAGFGLNIVPGW